MIGQTIDRYRIVAKLGEGGMGSVWEADDPALGRRVALKFLPEALAESQPARERFLREARTASTLQHPGIATVYDVRDTDGRVFIAMQRIDGMTVHTAVQRGPIAIAEALRIAIEAGTALQYAHERGVVHRDVSARNIMRGHDGSVVVVDFGLALPREQARLTASGAWMGTPAYVAPEVLQGATADARADVYALGVVLYEMLAGRLPFAAERAEAVLYAAVHDVPPPPSSHRPGIAGSIDAAVCKALAKQPSERYQTVAEFVRDLRAAARKTPSSRRTHAVLVVLAGVSLISLAVILVIFWRERHAPISADLADAPRVAILPLEDLSPDPSATSHIAVGIAATLGSRLTQVLGPRVVPWQTSRHYADPARSPAEVGRKLGAQILVTGTFQKLGDRVRVTLALVQPETGLQSWARDFEGTWSEVFDLQGRIAVETAAQLHAKLTGRDKQELRRPVSQSVEAFDRYLRGAAELASSGEAAADRAMDLFQQAVAIDPRLAEAYVGMGAVHSDRYFFGWGGAENLTLAEKQYRRALEVNQNLQAARSGLVRAYSDGGEAERCLQVGVEADRHGHGDAEEYLVRAEAYCLCGLADKAVPLLQRVLELDPESQAAHWFMVLACYWAEQWQAAIDAGQVYLAKFDPEPELLYGMAVAYLGLDDVEQARLFFDLSIRTFEEGDYTNIYVYAYAGILHRDMGEEAKARELWQRGSEVAAEKLRKSPDNVRIRSLLAELAGHLGNREAVDEQAAYIRHKVETVSMPSHGIHIYNIAIGYLALGEYDEAIDSLFLGLKRSGYHSTLPMMVRLTRKEVLALPAYQDFLRQFEADGERMRALY